MNSEAKVRPSTQSVVLGKAKRMSSEDIEEDKGHSIAIILRVHTISSCISGYKALLPVV